MNEHFPGVVPKLTLLGVVVFAAGPILAQTGVVTGLSAMGISVAGAALCAVMLAAGFAFRTSKYANFTGVSAAIGVIPVAITGAIILFRGDHPLMNDVTTDTKAPIHLVDRGPGLSPIVSYPDAFASMAREHYADIVPVTLKLPVDQARAAVDATLAALSESETLIIGQWREHEGAFILEGDAVLGLFRYVDDWAIRVRPATAGGGAVIDMRSRSREGKGDFGVNAARIRRFFGALQDPGVASRGSAP